MKIYLKWAVEYGKFDLKSIFEFSWAAEVSKLLQ